MTAPENHCSAPRSAPPEWLAAALFGLRRHSGRRSPARWRPTCPHLGHVVRRLAVGPVAIAVAMHLPLLKPGSATRVPSSLPCNWKERIHCCCKSLPSSSPRWPSTYCPLRKDQTTICAPAPGLARHAHISAVKLPGRHHPGIHHGRQVRLHCVITGFKRKVCLSLPSATSRALVMPSMPFRRLPTSPPK